ncbi:hypothetical protein E1286_41280 [Nonomuraea terrae]|uniref:Uncharacterized protein n=1 Tax=Nonomuraea terrae TaxID=2530383 RepID=A0A4R4XS91_9ACTN|nr:hypothetical protein [Nonomuraea terrae]TDD34093.1 hypothetical protein E1286_41280 [Nonomuraea terrae]
MREKQQLLREAADKESLATALTRYAKGLSDAFEGVPSRPEEYDPFWTGPSAGRHLARTQRVRREMADLVDACLITAENLRRRAQRLRETAARLPDPT